MGNSPVKQLHKWEKHERLLIIQKDENICLF